MTPKMTTGQSLTLILASLVMVGLAIGAFFVVDPPHTHAFAKNSTDRAWDTISWFIYALGAMGLAGVWKGVQHLLRP